jgi:hypothetical protein
MLKDLFRRPRFALAKPVPGLWSGKIARKVARPAQPSRAAWADVFVAGAPKEPRKEQPLSL